MLPQHEKPINQANTAQLLHFSIEACPVTFAVNAQQVQDLTLNHTGLAISRHTIIKNNYSLLPVIDLAQILGLGPSSQRSSTLIVTHMQQAYPHGFKVEHADQFIEVDWQTIKPLPKLCQSAYQAFLTAVFTYHDQLVEILNLEKIIEHCFHEEKANELSCIKYEYKLQKAKPIVLVMGTSPTTNYQIQQTLAQLNCQTVCLPDMAHTAIFLQQCLKDKHGISKQLACMVAAIEQADIREGGMLQKMKQEGSLQKLPLILTPTVNGTVYKPLAENGGVNKVLDTFSPNSILKACQDFI